MRRLAGLATVWLFPALAAAAPVGAARLRTDLSAAFTTALCAGEAGELPLAAWAAGVHDAQVEGRFLSRPAGRPVTARELEHKARALAQLRGAGGYAFGACSDGRGWALALPAPEPLVAEPAGRLRLPAAALAERCASYRADFAPRGAAAPRPVAASAGAVLTAGLGDGVLSLTCQPKTPRWRGPVLWYLYPVGAGPAAAPPGAEALSGTAARAGALAAWINRVRALSGLRALAFRSDLTAQAEILAIGGGLAHDRLLLARAGSQMAAAQEPTRLLGEERVKGKDAATMAWLLWNSPRHRDLLLRREATAAGLGERSVGDEHLAVLVVGESAALKTARGTAPPGTPRL